MRVEYKSHDSAMQDKSSFRNTNVWRGDQRSDRRNQRSGPPPGHYGGHNLRHDRDDGWEDMTTMIDETSVRGAVHEQIIFAHLEAVVESPVEELLTATAVRIARCGEGWSP